LRFSAKEFRANIPAEKEFGVCGPLQQTWLVSSAVRAALQPKSLCRRRSWWTGSCDVARTPVCLLAFAQKVVKGKFIIPEPSDECGAMRAGARRDGRKAGHALVTASIQSYW